MMKRDSYQCHRNSSDRVDWRKMQGLCNKPGPAALAAASDTGLVAVEVAAVEIAPDV